MNANDNEGHDSRMDEMLAEHHKPEDRAPLAGDGKRYPDGSWQALADEDDTQPVSFSDRVQFAPPSSLTGVDNEERRKLENKITTYESVLANIWWMTSPQSSGYARDISNLCERALGKSFEELASMLPSEQETRIAELEAAIRAMVQEAYEADELKPNHWCAVIMDIGWEALGK